MEKLTKSIDQTMVSMLTKCMLNPSNKDFYIGSLTLEKVQTIFNEINDSEFASVFWTAYSIAQAEYIKEQKFIEFLDTYAETQCPECGCYTYQGYVPGVKCPNCDYVED